MSLNNEGTGSAILLLLVTVKVVGAVKVVEEASGTAEMLGSVLIMTSIGLSSTLTVLKMFLRILLSTHIALI